MPTTSMPANIPLTLEFPEDIRASVTEVLDSKYEAGFDGSGLVILDIGANVGAFALWANLRWPGSHVHAYEPGPETFAMLERNTAHLANVTRHNVAVYPSQNEQELFFSGYPGDGESGLVACLKRMFEELPPEKISPVRVLHPRRLPACDVLKIDTEGAEPAILAHMDLRGVSLIMVEYHYGEDRDAIKALLDRDFCLVYDRSYEWGAILDGWAYRKSLAGDCYGNLCFAHRQSNKLAARPLPEHALRRRLPLTAPSVLPEPAQHGPVSPVAPPVPPTPAPHAPISSIADGAATTAPLPSERVYPAERARTRWRPFIYLRDLVAELVARDMKLRYKRSAMGFVWSLLNPLAQLLVLNFVFSVVLPLDIPNYSSFLFSGLLVWNWFSSALLLSADAIVGQRELVRRPGFPTAILPVVTVTSQLVHFLLALPVLLLFLALAGIPLTAAALALPLVIAIQFVLTLSLAYFVATFHVTFRDTQYLLGVLLLLGFYLTPIFYDIGAIPPQFQPLYRLNPMAGLLEAYRLILMQGRLPDLGLLLVLGISGLVLLYAGYRVFRGASAQFAEEL